MSFMPIEPAYEPRHLVADALRYAAKGLAVFPLHGVNPDGSCGCGRPGCPSAGKHPVGDLVPHGVQEATTDPGLIREWWATYPDANIAIACGTRSGLIVVDVDADRGGHETLAALEEVHEPLPQTWTVKTGGGGEHRYFSLPPNGDFRNSANTVGAGIDIRANNGYVVAPPSLHASGTRYAWSALAHPRFVERAILPAWIAEKLTKPAPERPVVKRDDFAARMSDETIQKIIKELRPHWREGSRHALALAVSALFAKAGVPEEQTDDLIADLASNDDDPRDRMIAVRTSYERVRLGQPTQGFTALSGHLPAPLIDWLDKQADDAREAAKPRISYRAPNDSFDESQAVARRERETISLVSQPPAIAYHGVIGDYVDLVSPTTEASDALHLGAILTVIGAMIGRRIGAKQGGDVIYPQLYTVLVGATGWSRKETVMKRAIINFMAPPATGDYTILSRRFYETTDLTSAEGLAEVLKEHPNTLVSLSELTALLSNMRRKGTENLADNLIKLWDSPEVFEIVRRRESTRVEEPAVSILAATQPGRLAAAMTDEHIISGFANRMIFVTGAPKPPMAEPDALDKRTMGKLYSHVCHLIDGYKHGTVLARDPATNKRWTEWYLSIRESAITSEDADAMRPRHQIMALKVALIYAVTDGADCIGADHLEAAIAFVEWVWSTVMVLMRAWGVSHWTQIAQRIEAALTERGPMARHPLSRLCANRRWHIRDFSLVLDSLIKTEGVIASPDGLLAWNAEANA